MSKDNVALLNAVRLAKAKTQACVNVGDDIKVVSTGRTGCQVQPVGVKFDVAELGVHFTVLYNADLRPVLELQLPGRVHKFDRPGELAAWLAKSSDIQDKLKGWSITV
jgi:hypothetical protein